MRLDSRLAAQWAGFRNRRKAYCLLLGLILGLPACGWDGHLCILGYTTHPSYDTSIRTVYVPGSAQGPRGSRGVFA